MPLRYRRKTPTATPTKALRSGVQLALFLLAWNFFAPLGLGGSTAYAMIVGNSMGPEFKTGDLVAVRPSPQYRAGDIVLYQHPDIGTILHRIIGRQRGGFLLQGDNNPSPDSYYPVPQEIYGRLMLHLPQMGDLVKDMRKPGIWTGMVMMTALMTVPSIVKDLLPRNRKPDGRRAPKAPPRRLHYPLQFTLGCLAALGLVLSVISFSSPILIEAKDPIAYQHQGSFDYQAPVPEGIYDGDVLHAGSPIFRRLTKDIDLIFSYTLETEGEEELAGEYLMVAQVFDTNGWRRTFELIPATDFTGSSFITSTSFDFSIIQDTIDHLGDQTGIEKAEYRLQIIPVVHIQGTLDGEPLDSWFSPELGFLFNNLQVQLAFDVQEPEAMIYPSLAGEILRSRMVPNTIDFLRMEIKVLHLRLAALLLLAAAGVGGFWFWRSTRSLARLGESRRIDMLFGTMIVQVKTNNISLQHVTEVLNIEDLVSLAEHYHEAILSLQNGSKRDFYVHTPQITYHYRLNGEAFKQEMEQARAGRGGQRR